MAGDERAEQNIILVLISLKPNRVRQTFARPAAELILAPRELDLPIVACGFQSVARRRHFHGLRELLVGEDRPDQHQLAVPHHRDQVVAFDVEIDLRPWSPRMRDARAAAVVIRMWCVEGPREDVQILIVVVLVAAHNLQAGHLIEILKIVGQSLLRHVVVEVRLEQLIFQILEERRLAVAQIRLDPVFGVQPDLPVCLPHAEVFHPAAPLRPFRIADRDVCFEAHQAALRKQLHRADGLFDS